MKQINIGLLGCGTVGTGVAKLLIENQDLLTARVGAELNLKWIPERCVNHRCAKSVERP
jgi:homoserine dehydrogenase